MAASKQIVISLNKLKTPPQKNHPKIILSALTPQNEYFILNPKAVKENKVNFYRQSLFINDLSTDLYFKLYEIDASSSRRLVTVFVGKEGELKGLNKRPTNFHLTSDGYELVWDGWLFSQNSSDLNQSTEKDYSELDLPFPNQDEQISKLALSNSHSQNLRPTNLVAARQRGKKRSSSTEQAASLSEEPLQFSEDEQNRSQPPKQLQSKTSICRNNDKNGSGGSGVPGKKKTHIKSHLYTSLVSSISELLSPAKS